MIEIIPAIDIISRRCVRLTKGDYGSVRLYATSPASMAALYAGCGVRRIHMVDLDGARESRPVNLAALRAAADAAPGVEIEWGGGISSAAALEEVLSSGATCAIVGSVAALEPQTFAGWLQQYGGERIVLGADVRDGLVAVKGWAESSSVTAEELLSRFEPLGLTQCVVTDISRDGMLQGPSQQLYTRLQERFPSISITVSGGISSMDDIRALDALSLRRVIVGKAIYEGHISLEDIRLWSQNA